MKVFQLKIKKEADLPLAKQYSEFDSPQTLIFSFFSKELVASTSYWNKISSYFPNSTIVGCSTAGEIMGADVDDESIVLTGCKFNQASFDAQIFTIDSAKGSHTAGVSIGEYFKNRECKGIVILSDGMNVNGSALVGGVEESLDENIPIAGGLAGDQDKFTGTFTMFQNRLFENGVVVVGFFGDSFEMGTGFGDGWDKFGPERVITKSNSTKLYEIDNSPALDLYKRYLGDQADNLPSSALLFPLLLTSSENSSNQVVRTILSIDENERSMTFAGDMPVGSRVQLMKGNMERLIDAAGDAAVSLKSEENRVGESLSLIFSCVGRRIVLGQRTVEELECVDSVIPDDIKAGFYSYGEICRLDNSKLVVLHNETVTMARIWEKQ